jgi:hypothetical protein
VPFAFKVLLPFAFQGPFPWSQRSTYNASD